MSLFAELQRRSVFKVGAAYLVVAWLVIQAASIAFPTFAAPEWALRVSQSGEPGRWSGYDRSTRPPTPSGVSAATRLATRPP